jgi:hypothetical protein
VLVGVGFALLCTVLLAIALERGAQDLPASPRSFLIWYWVAGLAGGGVWGALRRHRKSLLTYVISGVLVGAVIITPLAVLIPIGERTSIDLETLLITAVAGVPAGAVLGLMAWLRRSRS